MTGLEDGERRWINALSGVHSGVSKMSQELFRRLDKILCPKYTTQCASKGGEYFVTDNGYVIHLDYFIKELNICIEFNGGCFHGDTRLFSDDTHCNPFNKSLTAKEIREKDSRRYELLKNKFNITTFVIWELDFDEDFDEYDFITKTLNIGI